MGVLFKRGLLLAAICGVFLAAIPGSADEICLKDGKKLYGVIVAYENHMFKVKTDFGYVLVEKDKIAQINPGPSSEAAAKSAANTETPAKPEPVISPASNSGENNTEASGPAAAPAPTKREKTAAVRGSA